MWSALGKYKSIVVSIALFLLLDASVLILNFYISFKISDDAIGVNLAGRQRMLSQRTIKSLYELESSEVGSKNYKNALAELALSQELFDMTLSAFANGGTTKDTNGVALQLKAVESTIGLNALKQAQTLWTPYSSAITQVLNHGDSTTSSDYLPEAMALAQANNLPLLKLMNQLTVDLENIATSKATTLRYIQTVGISLAIVNFLIIIFHFLKELRTNDRKLEASRKETTDILDTVNGGLFLLDENQVIAGQHSACLPKLFGREDVANLKFTDLIRGLVKPKDMETAERFIALLFRPDIKSNLIQDLNPLNEIELQIPLAEGGHQTRFLNFDFKRVHSDDKKNILVTVNDVTRSTVLAAELAQEKERNEQQMEMLTGILHTEHAALCSFLDSAFSRFEKINTILKDKSKTHESLQRKSEKIFIEVHSFKGDSSALGLDSFADLAHRFEQQIKKVQDMESISGNDFLGLAVHLEGLIRYTEDIQEITSKLAKFASASRAAPDTPTSSPHDKWEKLRDLADSVAARENKDVYITLSGLKELALNEETENLVNDLCVQFIRNSIVHSIEDVTQRVKHRKRPQARIEVQLVSLSGGELELSVSDDGQGIDYEKIRKQALSKSQATESEIRNWDDKKLLKMIFEPGFSTADNVGQDAGQGIGMSVIRERINQAGGRLRITNRSGSNCKFVVTLPRSSKDVLAA